MGEGGKESLLWEREVKSRCYGRGSGHESLLWEREVKSRCYGRGR